MTYFDEELIIVTPHNEAIRYEFAEGFKDWYYQKFQKKVSIDWRVLGGTQEIVRSLDATYLNAFCLHWEEALGQIWNVQVEEAFKKRGSHHEPPEESLDAIVQDAFLQSNVSCGIDILFGGGMVDMLMQARKGQIVPSGIFDKKPQWFTRSKMPQTFGGNYFWDAERRWVGTAISGFGIVFNRDALVDLGIDKEPEQWVELTHDAYLGEIALVDPCVSASFTVIFEMILQQQMQESLASMLDSGTLDTQETQALAIEQGWFNGMQVIQKIIANGRYFADASTGMVLDVSAGNCAVGMAIDFYGFFQEENLKIRSGSQRFGFVMPKGGSLASPDPIALLRGALHPDLALAFIEYVLSLEGQKKWDYKVSTPGGPKVYALNRAPIRREMYKDPHLRFRNNPNLNPYRELADFNYRPEWTAHLFQEIRFIIKAAFIDAHNELVHAWSAIINAKKQGRMHDYYQALEQMQVLDSIDYDAAVDTIKRILSSPDPLKVVQFQAEVTRNFRRQYKHAQALANNPNLSSG